MTDTSGHVFSAIAPAQSPQLPSPGGACSDAPARPPGRPLCWLTNILKHLKRRNMSPLCLETVSNL